VLGTHGAVGHLAVQLAGADSPPRTNRATSFSTPSVAMSDRAIGSAPRLVSVAEEAAGVTYFVVDPNHAQLVELATRADAGVLKPAIDSSYPLEEAAAAFARVGQRSKRGKIVLHVTDD
jgi:NADPH:quinone reductase-like Zn-dependent oxidoreductase